MRDEKFWDEVEDSLIYRPPRIATGAAVIDDKEYTPRVRRAAKLAQSLSDANDKANKALRAKEAAAVRFSMDLKKLVADEPESIEIGWVAHHLTNTVGWSAAEFVDHYEKHGMDLPKWLREFKESRARRGL